MALKDDEKLAGFAREALGEANAIAQELLEQTENEKKQELEQGERQISNETQRYIQGELEKLRRQHSQEISRHTMESRKDFLLYRETVLQKVLNGVMEKIQKFIKTPEYETYLVNLCKMVLRKQTDSFTIYLSVEDMSYKYEILEELDHLVSENASEKNLTPIYSILPDKNIKLGGARFYSVANGILINETLDENLNRQREYFTLLLGPVLQEEEKNGG